MNHSTLGEVPHNADKWFPTIKPLSDDPTLFELALVLGGTVSAGTYTAGALDFLLEALEAWHGQARPPPHRVRIPFVSGSSGGSVCAAILAVMTRAPVPHVNGSLGELTAGPPRPDNPLWHLWVDEYDVSSLLGNDDLAGVGGVQSLLNTALLDRMEAQVIRFAQQGEAESLSSPSYFQAPFRLAVTLTNVRGIPYRMDSPGVSGFPGAVYLQHNDYARFAIPNGADRSEKRADEFWVVGDGNRQPGDAGYEVLAGYASASGAAPGLLRARNLERPREHYCYRPTVRPLPAPCGFRVDWPQPDWEGAGLAGDAMYGFTATDGGLFNNDPVRLAHEALAGLAGVNPSEPERARRALLMIHPLAQQAVHPTLAGTNLVELLPSLLRILVEGARFETADMALLGNRGVFSRFHLAPSRDQPTRVGPEAVVGSHLFGVAGFLGRAWRVHDFLLGRMNMQNFIRRTFTMRGDNPLFHGWNDALRAQFAVREDGEPSYMNPRERDQYYLPILPDLTGGLPAAPAAIPVGGRLPWPRAEPALDVLRPLLHRRFRRLLQSVAAEVVPGWGGRIAGRVAAPLAAFALERALTGRLLNELRNANLLPSRPWD